ncbi:hypothetical protein [Pseudobacteriovorax antillogorgiicola]|uniref:Uncharacterized protein n=2 Tax=Pseudobacteriovorax antillogorgiicola TaxID=1513793 RepID=A0A1Y6C819_9BACT|nr:hypothetical protein [Pseudobacteriovorax antillogorgiicola]TCS51773.1 hypothetical protein EDD56_110158 [Pseudobacteriovorax antillogorgiicola]SMF49879.1 hypothetical protein SAMN06296036_115127 [Pseudobacteriovorax antillogorgiicola]
MYKDVSKVMFFSLGLLVFLSSCSQAPKIQSRRGTQTSADLDIGREPAKVSLNFASEPQQDAFEYTFGVVPMKFDQGGAISIQKSALIDRSQVSEENRPMLTELCRDLEISTSSTDPSLSPSTISQGEELYVFWRSHYPAKLKSNLADFIISGRIQCSLSISIGDEAVDIVFNPVPTVAGEILGTKQADAAIDEILMMIDSSASGTRLAGNHSYEVIAIDEPSDIILGVEGLHQEDIQVTPQDSQTTCRYHSLNGETKLGNPEDLQSFAYNFSAPDGVDVGEIIPTSSGGRSLEACQVASPTPLESGFSLGISCESYMEIQTQGQGDTCGWAASASNPNDPKNTVSVGLRMSPTPFETIDIGNPVGALKVIEAQDKNPITLNTLDVTTFSTPQVDSLQRAFDFWLGASPTSYATFWEGNISKITYLGNTQACAEQGVLAYVTSLDTDEIFWCELAGVRQQDLSEQRSPLVLMLIAVTALHENLHAIGREHDFDAPAYEPCKGTSESGVLSYDTAINCQEDSCFAMKDLAIQEYIVELDYSLQADGRRFQGLCQQWNAAMGLSQGDFGS